MNFYDHQTQNYIVWYNIYFMLKLFPYIKCQHVTTCTVKPVLRGHLWDKEKVAL